MGGGGFSVWCHYFLSGCLVPCSFWEGLWSHVPSGGSLSRGVYVWEEVSVRETPQTETPLWWRAGGTHPTGMLSFFQGNFVKASTTSFLCNFRLICKNHHMMRRLHHTNLITQTFLMNCELKCRIIRRTYRTLEIMWVVVVDHAITRFVLQMTVMSNIPSYINSAVTWDWHREQSYHGSQELVSNLFFTGTKITDIHCNIVTAGCSL